MSVLMGVIYYLVLPLALVAGGFLLGVGWCRRHPDRLPPRPPEKDRELAA